MQVQKMTSKINSHNARQLAALNTPANDNKVSASNDEAQLAKHTGRTIGSVARPQTYDFVGIAG